MSIFLFFLKLLSSNVSCPVLCSRIFFVLSSPVLSCPVLSCLSCQVFTCSLTKSISDLIPSRSELSEPGSESKIDSEELELDSMTAFFVLNSEQIRTYEDEAELVVWRLSLINIIIEF